LNFNESFKPNVDENQPAMSFAGFARGSEEASWVGKLLSGPGLSFRGDAGGVHG
jgi:hypothetical protein